MELVTVKKVEFFFEIVVRFLVSYYDFYQNDTFSWHISSYSDAYCCTTLKCAPPFFFHRSTISGYCTTIFPEGSGVSGYQVSCYDGFCNTPFFQHKNFIKIIRDFHVNGMSHSFLKIIN